MTAITKETAKFLELHAMEYQSKKIAIANHYIADYKKYIHVLNFLNNYISTIENYIDRADTSQGENNVPFVIIGSIVDIRDASDNKTCTLVVREPGARHADSPYEEVSCLSGLGQALLFKEAGEEIRLQETDCDFTGTVEKVRRDFKL
jgi:transcription elongation GreA/GreB family factor